MGILVTTTLICGGETLALSRLTKLCSDSTYIGALEEKVRAHRLRATVHDPPFAIPALRLPQRARVLVAGAGRDRGAEEETALLVIHLWDPASYSFRRPSCVGLFLRTRGWEQDPSIRKLALTIHNLLRGHRRTPSRWSLYGRLPTGPRPPGGSSGGHPGRLVSLGSMH